MGESTNQHQMGTDAACGDTLYGAVRRLALVADNQRQDWPLRSGQGSLTYYTVNSTVRAVRLWHGPHSIPIAHGRTLAVEQLRVRLQSGLRRRMPSPILPMALGVRLKFKRDLIGARSLCLQQHISCQGSDALECHSKTPLSQVGFNTKRPNREEDEACSQSPLMRFSQ